MKKILFILSILFAFNADAQWLTPNNSFGTISNRANFKKVLIIPTGCGAPALNAVDSAQNGFSFYGDSCNNKAYIYNPGTKIWTMIPIIITQNTAFNKNFGTTPGTVADGGDMVARDSIANIANNLTYVHKAGTDTITGIKTFQNYIKFQNPTEVLIHNGGDPIFSESGINGFTSIGDYAGYAEVLNATYPEGFGNSWYGSFAGYTNTYGKALVGIGAYTLGSYDHYKYFNHSTDTTGGADMTFVGYNAAGNTTTGVSSVGVGNETGYNIFNLKNATLIGAAAYDQQAVSVGFDSSSNVIVIGTGAIQNHLMDSSIAIGTGVGSQSTGGKDNILLGDLSGRIMAGNLVNTTILGHNTYTYLDSVVAIGSASQNVIIGPDSTITDWGGQGNRAFYYADNGNKLQIHGSASVTSHLTIPTEATSDSSNYAASTAWVKNQHYGSGTGTVTSVAGRTGAVVLTKSDVGLANVDNTSDISKPVSTAMQTALNLKANDNAVAHLSGNNTFTGTNTFPSIYTSAAGGIIGNLDPYGLTFNRLLAYIKDTSAGASIIFNSDVLQFRDRTSATTYFSFSPTGIVLSLPTTLNSATDSAGDFLTRNSSTGLLTKRTAAESLTDMGGLSSAIAASTYASLTANNTFSGSNNTFSGANLYVNNGSVGVGSTGTLHLGDGTVSKSYGSSWVFGGSVNFTGRLSVNVVDHAQGNFLTYSGGNLEYQTPSETLTDIGAEPAFSKNTAFNKNFGTTTGTVADGGAVTASLAGKVNNTGNEVIRGDKDFQILRVAKGIGIMTDTTFGTGAYLNINPHQMSGTATFFLPNSSSDTLATKRDLALIYSSDSTNIFFNKPLVYDSATKTVTLDTVSMYGLRPYKVFTASITSNTTSAPTVSQLENTTGATVTSVIRNSVGNYTIIFSSNIFPVSTKMIVFTNNIAFTDGAQLFWGYQGTDRIRLFCQTPASSTGAAALSNDELSNASLEIKIYP